MTPKQLSARLVDSINGGGTIAITPDFTRKTEEYLQESDHIAILWGETVLYEFNKQRDGTYTASVTIEGEEPENTIVPDYFVNRVISVLKERLAEPDVLTQSYNPDGSPIIDGEEH
jgi:hypothetical protein